LMLGITFKENCPDVRNTKIVDVIAALKDYGIRISIYDPWANPSEVAHEYGLVTANALPKERYDAVVLGVAHEEFAGIDFSAIKKENCVVYDVKGILGNRADAKL
jgi:UDP-N-acetyl-D-galactosamine dehydrogenase